MKLNPYNVGVGGMAVTWLYVIILAFFWRAVAATLANSEGSTKSTIGAAMGSTL